MTELARTPTTVAADLPAATDGLPLGPDSLVWKYFGDRRIALIGPRPAVLQNMLAGLGQGVKDHSVFFADTAARIKRSLPPIYRTVYGSEDDNAGPQLRCKGLQQLTETINAQAPELRAQMVRQFFGD